VLSASLQADDRTAATVGSILVRVHTVHMWRDPVIEVYKQHVDRTLLRENLRLTVEERFRKLMDLQRFAEELQRAGREARRRDRAK
jgi:DNA repair ATPase RecN